MWFDSHCHLHLCEDAPSELVSRARAGGVSDITTVGIDLASSERSRALAHELGVWYTAGLHPNSATEWTGDLAERLEPLIEDERCVAVGESGLDFYRDAAPAELQHEAFRHHIGWAKSFDRALVIHTRASVGAAIEALEDVSPPDRLVFHCWSGNADELGRAVVLGSYVSFAGNVSFKNAEDLREAARLVPEDRLLVETDSPFLSPMPFRGKPNEPGRVVHVGEALAEARGAEVEEIARITFANARALYGIDQ